ncbi:hypothetical protein PsorP6_001434 [Peronosclerospora sorghi]|uniref:Uncharacterized protein n=1 Tax=Peronosclerospora sorghi TaxID=230839 RepID=A0ACC0WSU1_9STRA|nr:hypothetical protein PsorP6_001434 [Peronosclerospora sorghi]
MDNLLRQNKLMSPSVLDGAVLHTMRATKDSYLGIKWQAEHAFGGKREVCFVDMVGYTVDQDGHEEAFVAMASINVPECPPVAKFTRHHARAPGDRCDPRHVRGFCHGTSEATESSLTTLAQHRPTMIVLSDLSLVIDSKKLPRCASCTSNTGFRMPRAPVVAFSTETFSFSIVDAIIAAYAGTL